MAGTKQQKQRKQEKLVIGGALFIIALSIITTLWVSGVLFSSGDKGPAYKNVTFTDALITCENETRASYGSKLMRLVPDDHSSRYDSSSNQFKIFFKAAMTSSKSESGIGEFYINCYVNAERGRIADYDVYEQKDSPTEAIRKDEGGLFGWPINK